MSRRTIAVLCVLTSLAMIVATSLPTDLIAASKTSQTFKK